MTTPDPQAELLAAIRELTEAIRELRQDAAYARGQDFLKEQAARWEAGRKSMGRPSYGAD